MTNNGYSPSFFDYSRTFLPQLPQQIKNRNMERSRQALRTSSEEYGNFWHGYTKSPYIVNPTPETIAATSRLYQGPSAYSSQQLPDVNSGPTMRHVVDFRRNGSHRNGYDLVNNGYHSYFDNVGSATDRPPRMYDSDAAGASGLQRLATLDSDRGSRRWLLWPDDEDRARQNRYKLIITDDGRRATIPSLTTDWTLADLSRVDLKVHFRDNSVIDVFDIPFYYN